MKNLFLILLLAFLPLFQACDMDGNMPSVTTIDSIGVANTDGSGFKMIAQGNSALVTPDSKNVLFTDYQKKGLFSIGIDGNNLTSVYQDNDVSDFMISPDGMKIAFVAGYPPAIYLINADKSGLVPLYKSKSGKRLLNFSSDGSKIFFAETDSVSYIKRYISSVDLNGNYRLLSTDTSSGGLRNNPQISPDEKYVIYSKEFKGYARLFSRNLSTQKDSNLTDCDLMPDVDLNYPAKFISQNTFLYVYRLRVSSYDLLSGKTRDYITLPTRDYSYSQDGKKIIYSTDRNKITIAAIDGTSKIDLKISKPIESYFFFISPDNKKVIFSTIDYKNLP